jgi:2-dehydro-3-deoxygalactonokinase
MTGIACIAIDWGTSNRRAWAMTRDGAIVGERHDDQGLLAIVDRQFASSLQAFCGDWLSDADGTPIIMSGMIGSRLGWQEVPYQMAPVILRDLSSHLTKVDEGHLGGFLGDHCWIAPGVALDNGAQPEVMRGEECQILGALLNSGASDGIFILPGTHAKWVCVEGGAITAFRTYMTGEVFGLLRKSGTLSQLMVDDEPDDAAFLQGVSYAQTPDAANLLHSLFSVRTLGLFERLSRRSLASYMSGLLIGAEMKDALCWLADQGRPKRISAIGSPSLLLAYQKAAVQVQLDLRCQDSTGLLPVALLFLAQGAGLLSGDVGR